LGPGLGLAEPGPKTPDRGKIYWDRGKIWTEIKNNYAKKKVVFQYWKP
jgi:hypothetical protein